MDQQVTQWLHGHAMEGTDGTWRCRQTGAVIAVAARQTYPMPSGPEPDMSKVVGMGSLVCPGCIRKDGSSTP